MTWRDKEEDDDKEEEGEEEDELSATCDIVTI